MYCKVAYITQLTPSTQNTHKVNTLGFMPNEISYISHSGSFSFALHNFCLNLVFIINVE